MLCEKCKKKTIIKSTYKYCDECFLEIAEKRIRKEIRLNNLIKKNDNLLFIDSENYLTHISVFFIKRILKGMPYHCDITKSKFYQKKFSEKSKTIAKHNVIVLPICLDYECEQFLGSFMEGKNPGHIGNYKKGKLMLIKPLLCLTREECERIALILYKKKPKKEQKKSEISSFLDSLEKAHPETKHSLLKSIYALKKVYTKGKTSE
ncbi:MAG: hypothetical protein V1859_00755 [archaeon]